ncbi:hypothetical protein [Sulfitobacter pontiacus]|uniref:hypothetical protein n=1 Tax=Sulfitobacter pontiacus TaxID=60137 RepID=UPI0036DF371A
MDEQKTVNAATSAKVSGAKIEVASNNPQPEFFHENTVRAMTFFLDRSTNSVERLRYREVPA